MSTIGGVGVGGLVAVDKTGVSVAVDAGVRRETQFACRRIKAAHMASSRNMRLYFIERPRN